MGKAIMWNQEKRQAVACYRILISEKYSSFQHPRDGKHEFYFTKSSDDIISTEVD